MGQGKTLRRAIFEEMEDRCDRMNAQQQALFLRELMIVAAGMHEDVAGPRATLNELAGLYRHTASHPTLAGERALAERHATKATLQ